MSLEQEFKHNDAAKQSASDLLSSQQELIGAAFDSGITREQISRLSVNGDSGVQKEIGGDAVRLFQGSGARTVDLNEGNEHTIVGTSQGAYDTTGYNLEAQSQIKHKKAKGDKEPSSVTYGSVSRLGTEYASNKVKHLDSVKSRLDPSEIHRDRFDAETVWTKLGLRVDRTGAKGEKTKMYLTGHRAEKARDILQRRAVRKIDSVTTKLREQSPKDKAA